jgi:hypothetical protein
LTVLYGVVLAGCAAAVMPVFEDVTGRKPTGFREFAQANAAAWKRHFARRVCRSGFPSVANRRSEEVS